MSTKLPYVVAPSSVVKILNKVKDAKTPDRFTQDFLQTKLGFKGGNNRQFIPLAKKIGFLNSDGTPTDLYKKYRNPGTAKAAVAQAVRTGYRELFERNEYAGTLKKEELKGLVVEITGLEPGNKIVQLVCQTIEQLKSIADFDAQLEENGKSSEADGGDDAPNAEELAHEHQSAKIRLGLAYTINLVLPKTEDPAVFNAIFRSLRENLLRE